MYISKSIQPIFSVVIILGFVTMIIFQLYIPAKTIIDHENTLATGKSYKFKVMPIDPHDPFRGAYLVLNYTHNTIDIANTEKWSVEDLAYVSFTNTNDFATIESIYKRKPKKKYFLKTKILSVSKKSNTQKKLTVFYPFNRYYMTEENAQIAEQIYRRSEDYQVYALVKIKYGKAVLKDVFINDTPIKEWVKK